MSEERVIVLQNWPQPHGGSPTPVVVADEISLILRYLTKNGNLAVVHFPLCDVFTFGSPNEEALAGHPLAGRGLQFYAVHRVESSSWIELLERRNSVHPSHDRTRFLQDKNHYIFTFHDSTLECVVDEGKLWPAEIREFATESEADEFINAKRKT
jgi:hypothetical protein